MFTGELKRAFELSEKYRMDVSTVTELRKIIVKELDPSVKVEENVLTQILQLIESKKTFLREAKQGRETTMEVVETQDTFD